jgi:hypothetical protein
MATTPNFTSTSRLATAAVSTANTNRDGTGTIVSVLTGAAEGGTKVFEVDVQMTVTSTAGMVRLFLSSDTGSTWKLFDEVAIAAATVSASVKGTRVATQYANLILPSASWILGASTHNAEASVVTALGGDLT